MFNKTLFIVFKKSIFDQKKKIKWPIKELSSDLKSAYSAGFIKKG